MKQTNASEITVAQLVKKFQLPLYSIQF